MAHIRLGDLLVDSGIITNEDLEKGLKRQKETKERLGTALISGGIITEQQLVEVLQMQLGIEYIDLSKVNVPIAMAQVVPKNMAQQYQVIPVKVVKDELYLAMSDPLNFFATEDVRKVSRKKVIPMIAQASAIEHAIMILYGNEGAAKAIAEMKRESSSMAQAENTTESAFATNQLGDNTSNAPTIRLVNSILERAINERASDIHMEPREQEMHVRMRIDGMMRPILTVPKDLQSAVLSRVKIMSGLDITEHRIPQDGRFNVKIREKDIDLRVSTLPTVYGEKLVARLLDKSGGRLTKESIGLTGDDQRKYENMIQCSSGVILIVGPTGSGKSSTMYTMIGELNTDEVNLITLEDPVEYNIDGVNQVQINEKIGMTFAGGLRAILRQDPDIIAVGEIRDGETADICMRAAITGHVVLSTIHTNDAVGTIERLLDIGVEPYLIASALKGVVSQRLVRKICPKCRMAYHPSEDEAEFLDIPWSSDLTFYQGKGCPDCFHTGYRGRTAVFEMLPINRVMRRLISERKGRAEIENELFRDGSDFVSLRENAIQLVKNGTTTVKEIMRVTSEQD